MNCTDPPEKPGSGTWEWNGDFKFGTQISYTCGPFGNFQNGTGAKYPELVSSCAWNKTWVPSVLDPCVATSCQVIPFPPPETGLMYQPEDENSISFQSEFMVYNPRLPFVMRFPGAQFCDGNGDIMMVVGTYPSVNILLCLRNRNVTIHFQKKKKPFEVVFSTESIDEAYHVSVDVKNEVVQRWAVFQNITQEVFGYPGDGSSIDFDEPFVLRNLYFVH